MNKVLGYLFPVLLLIIFIFIMNSSDFVKDDNINKYINLLNNKLINEQWDNTEIYFLKLENTWEKNVNLLQFSVERSEIRNISSAIARLQGSLTAKDKSEALIELSNIEHIWNQLGE